MSQIEIRTSQNVIIDYEAAPLRDRIIGYLLDFFVMAVAGLILSIFIMIAFQSELVLVLILTPVFVFYSLAFELFNNGRSIGKMALGMRVIRADGQEMRLNDYLTRWAFRCIDIYGSFGGMAAIMVSLTKNSQRMGDFVGNTVVIKTRPTYSISLENVVKKKAAEGYEPVYPQAARFSEDQMLVLKNTVDRYLKYQNDAHAQAVRLLSATVAEKLGIEEPKKKIDFLKQVLKDYVILTR